MSASDPSDISIDGSNPEVFQPVADVLQEARSGLAGVALVTPLLPSKLRDGIFFKAENLQRTGSFKIRPAFHQIVGLSETQKKRGIVTSSSGNFAQGVAYAAQRLGLSAKVVMMKSSNPVKVDRTRQLGAQVVFCEDRFDAREEMVRQIREEEKRTEVHPFDRGAVIVANATIGMEILEQLPEVENVVVPVSGGGLIAGVATAVKLVKPSVRVWGVQPEGSNATFLSYRCQHPVAIDRAVTIADGLRVTRPGKLTFPVIQRHVDEMVVVKEESILAALRLLLMEEKLTVEPSGAVTLAAVVEAQIPAQKTVCVLSGGNISPEVIVDALAGQ